MRDKSERERDELRVVFSDAHVIDVDFSEWDKAVSLVVVADHLRPMRGRLQLVCVKFADVKRISFRFPRVGSLRSKSEHFQWWTTWIEWKELAVGKRFAIGGDYSMPKIEIVCDGVSVHALMESIFRKSIPVGASRVVVLLDQAFKSYLH